MSLLVLTMAAVAAASAGYFAARQMRKQSEATDREDAALAAPASPYSGLPMTLGDVVSANGDERWLSGAAIAREGERRVAVVFFAPEGAAYDAVSVLSPNRSIGWLSPTELTCPSEPPASIELNGTVYSRRARWPVSFECVGQGVPALGATGFIATYDAGERATALVLTSNGRTVALHGQRYDEGEYDCLGSGGGD